MECLPCLQELPTDGVHSARQSCFDRYFLAQFLWADCWECFATAERGRARRPGVGASWAVPPTYLLLGGRKLRLAPANFFDSPPLTDNSLVMRGFFLGGRHDGGREQETS